MKNDRDANVESGVSNWLSTLLLKEGIWGYDINKHQFWDAVRIRYNWNLERHWNLERLPTDCVYEEKIDLSYQPCPFL